MNRSKRIVLSMLVAGLALGCGGASSPNNPTPALTLNDLIGSWIATSATHTNQANTAQKFDVIAAGGEVRFTMLAGGGVRTWVEFGDVSDEWDSGTTLNGSTLTSDPVEAGRPTRVWTVQLASGVLTMTDMASSFDFTLTGATPVSTTEVVVFVRNQ